MVFAERQPEGEKPDFKEIRGSIRERIADHFKEHPERYTATYFGRNQFAMEEIGKRLLEFKDSGEPIIINDVGPGAHPRKKIRLLGKEVMTENDSYEPFELLNEARKAGIAPEKFLVYVLDIRPDVLITVKSTRTVRVPAGGSSAPIELAIPYLQNFFPDMQEKEKSGVIKVKIPKDYRRRIVCPEPFNIVEKPAPVQANITLGFLQGSFGSRSSSEEIEGDSTKISGISNLAKSTRSGGYLITHMDIGLREGLKDELLKELGLSKVRRVHVPDPQKVYSNYAWYDEFTVYRKA